MRTVTVTEAARAFSDLVNRVHYKGESALLTKGGRPMARLLPVSQGKTGRELSRFWPALPHLKPAEAARFSDDLKDARRKLPPLKAKWA